MCETVESWNMRQKYKQNKEFYRIYAAVVFNFQWYHTCTTCLQKNTGYLADKN